VHPTTCVRRPDARQKSEYSGVGALTPGCPFPSVKYLTLLLELLNYSAAPERMGRPVKTCRHAADDQTLAPIAVLNSRYVSGAEHVEAALAGFGLLLIVARAV